MEYQCNLHLNVLEQKMNKLKIYYSIQNGGDGSAYPVFFNTEELAEWDQDHLWEGWGESCCGSISFNSESPISCDDKIYDEVDYFLENYLFNKGKVAKEFIKQFFPKGLPTNFEVISDIPYQNEYVIDTIYLNDEKRLHVSNHISKSGKVFEDYLNSYEKEIQFD